MKKLNLIMIAGLTFLSVTCFYSCGDGNSDKEGTSDTTISNLENKMDKLESGSKDSLAGTKDSKKLGKEYTSKYICPDHCKGSGSDKPGTCANCGMELIENTSYSAK
jgi:hypothetical protein